MTRFNLKTSVGRTRVCCFRGGWQGATTPQAVACKEEQRRQATRKPCNRVRSGPTQWVSPPQRRKRQRSCSLAMAEERSTEVSRLNLNHRRGLAPWVSRQPERSSDEQASNATHRP